MKSSSIIVFSEISLAEAVTRETKLMRDLEKRFDKMDKAFKKAKK